MLSGNEVALISPSREFASEFLEVARESVSAGEDRYRDLLATGGDFADYVADLERQEQGTGGTPDSVPQTTYWLRRADGGILGTVRLRHRLTPSLEVFGGNIGYEIRPAQRRKGYGTRILELVLEKARGHGLSRVLLTCYDDNVGSIRVIEKNGGQLSDRVSLDNGKSTDDTGSIWRRRSRPDPDAVGELLWMNARQTSQSKPISRRRMIVGLATAAGVLAAAVGCGQQPSPAPIAVAPSPSPVPPVSPTAPAATTTPSLATAATAAPTSSAIGTKPAIASPPISPVVPTPLPTPRPTLVPGSGQADLVVVRGADPATITRAAVETLGGIKRFVKSGQVVVLKPNICTAMAPEYAATTNPEVVAALVTMCKEAGASTVKVLDWAWGSQRTNYKESGIEAAVTKAGGQMIAITPVKWKKTDIPNAKALKSIEIFDDVLTADVLINIPIAKDHGLTRLTLGMKNLMGVVSSREQFHMSMGQYLSDLLLQVKPAFTLVDAVRILTANGPGGGDLSYVKKLDTVIASTDIVAVDAYSTTLFGLKPDDIETIRIGAKNGLGVSDLTKLRIAEVAK